MSECGSEVKMLIFLFMSIGGEDSKAILSTFQLNSPRKVKLPISFCFSFASSRQSGDTAQSSFQEFTQLTRFSLKGKCLIVF